jgi:hypothetical protein
MVNSGVMKFPANEKESGKHWSQWTGTRPMTDQEREKWKKELPSRTGNDAKNRFIFYAVDDLLYSPKGKPSVYAIQSFAKEQLNEINAKEKMLGIDYQSAASTGLKTRAQNLTPEEAKEMLITKQYLQKIINTPETDQGAWSELTSGIVDNFELPFLGSIIGISKNILSQSISLIPHRSRLLLHLPASKLLLQPRIPSHSRTGNIPHSAGQCRTNSLSILLFRLQCKRTECIYSSFKIIENTHCSSYALCW